MSISQSRLQLARDSTRQAGGRRISTLSKSRTLRSFCQINERDALAHALLVPLAAKCIPYILLHSSGRHRILLGWRGRSLSLQILHLIGSVRC